MLISVNKSRDRGLTKEMCVKQCITTLHTGRRTNHDKIKREELYRNDTNKTSASGLLNSLNRSRGWVVEPPPQP